MEQLVISLTATTKKEGNMFTKSFRIIVTAVLLVSMTTLSLPMGAVYAADSWSAQTGSVMETSSDNLYFKKIADVPPPPPPEPEQKDEQAPDTSNASDNVNRVENAAPQPEVADVSEEDQEALEPIFGPDVEIATSETISLDGGMTTIYYDAAHKEIGRSTQTVGTQYVQPTKWFGADGKQILDANGNPFEATLISPGDEQDALEDNLNATPSWMKVTYNEDHSVATTNYYDVKGVRVGAKEESKDADNKNVVAWTTLVPADKKAELGETIGTDKDIKWQKVSTSADGKVTTTQYFAASEDGKTYTIVGQKQVTTGADGKKTTTWRTQVAAADKPAIQAKLNNKTPAMSEVTTAADGTVTTKYYNDKNEYIGQKTVTKDKVETWTATGPEGSKPATADEKQGYKQIFGTEPTDIKTETVNGKTTITLYDSTGKVIGRVETTGDQASKFFKGDGATATEIANSSIAEALAKTDVTADTASKVLGLLNKVTAAAILADAKMNSAKAGQILAKMTAAAADGILAELDKNTAAAAVTKTTEIRAWILGSFIPDPPVQADGDWEGYFKALGGFLAGRTDAGLRQMAWDRINNALADPKHALPSAATIQNLMNEMASDLKRSYRDDTYKIDLSLVRSNLVGAALLTVQSEAFKALDDYTKVGFIGAFGGLALELSWRKANGTTALYTQIGNVYKALLEDPKSSPFVTSIAFQNLMGVWRTAIWGSVQGNLEGANAFLKVALSGGMDALIASWQTILKDNPNNDTGEHLGWAASALAQVIWQHGWINAVSTKQITGDQLKTLAADVATFLGKVDEGKITISAGMKNHLINCVGSALIISMGLAKDSYETVSEYQHLGEAYIALADNCLNLTPEQGGSVGLKTSVINVTYSLYTSAMANFARTKDDDAKHKAQACLNVLFQDGFDADQYLTDAQALMGAAGYGADTKAWVAGGMNNLAKLRLENDKAVAEAQIAKGVAAIKNWITAPKSLKDMRQMLWQAGVYTSLSDLLQQVAKKNNGDLDSKTDLCKDIAAIFKTLVNDTADSSVKDSLVRSMGKDALGKFIGSLKAGSQLRKDLEALQVQIVIETK
jgi:hypothetical protein